MPPHLGNYEEFEIHVADYTPGLDELLSMQQQIMFEFAIGARQRLWGCAEAVYYDDRIDPTSRFCKPNY